jgi:hypothetical protein
MECCDGGAALVVFPIRRNSETKGEWFCSLSGITATKDYQSGDRTIPLDSLQAAIDFKKKNSVEA